MVEMLSNGCLPTGHKYAAYGMCTICGGYEEWIELDRSYKDIRIDIEEE